MTQQDGPTCQHCAHWAPIDGQPAGECYLNPPTIHVDEDGYELLRPILDADSRVCGQYKGKQ